MGFVALAHVGCVTTIAGRYPHLDRRSVCLVVPGIESDSTEYVFTEANVPISNFHPGLVDRVAPEARTVFEVNPDADPTSVTYLPAPYNQLTCPERFSALPSSDAQNPALPKASVDLLVHEPHQEFVRRAVAEKLANCLSQSGGQLKATAHTMRLDVYLANDGQAVSAYVAQSTLGDRKTEACMLNVLRSTSWPAVVASVPEVSAAPAAPALKTFLAQPAPAGPPPNSGPISEIRLKPQPWVPPASDPGGFRVPRVFVLPLSPLAAGAAVFGFIFFYSSKDALPWMSEMNPITGQPYTSLQEYEQVRQLSFQQILAAQRAHIKATQPQAPPAAKPVAGSRRYPGQTCEDTRLDELQAAMKAICKGFPGEPCRPTRENAERLPLYACSLIKARIAAAEACVAARQKVQDECFKGSPEPGHEEQIDGHTKGITWCEALKATNCAPGHPMSGL